MKSNYLTFLLLFVTSLLSAQERSGGWVVSASFAPDLRSTARTALAGFETTEMDTPSAQRGDLDHFFVDGQARVFHFREFGLDVPVSRKGVPVAAGVTVLRQLPFNLSAGVGLSYTRARYAYVPPLIYNSLPNGGLLVGNGEVETTRWSPVFRVEYHPLRGRRWQPYVGVALGATFARLRADNEQATYSSSQGNTLVELAGFAGAIVDRSTSDPVVQPSAGLLYGVTDRLQLGLSGVVNPVAGQGYVGVEGRFGL